MSSYNFTGPLHVVCECDSCKRAQETAQAQRKTLSRLADEVMKHQWSNSREAMTALQELMDALPKDKK